MKLIVTGGAGFIGSDFLRMISQMHPEWTLVNVDKLTYAGDLCNLKQLETNSRYRFVQGDICDRELMSALAKDVDAIINFAAETHVDRSIANSDEFIRTDMLGVQVLLSVVKARKIPRFVHISTDEVYGPVLRGSADETAAIKPCNPYAASKAGGDLLALSYWNTYRLPVIITRCTNNYGPYQYPEKIIPFFITRALQDMTVPLYGDGRHQRDWIYVRDHCRALYEVMMRGKIGEIYNIGAGRCITNLELTRRILALLGKPDSLIEFVGDRPGHDRRYSLRTEKIKKELKWAAEMPFSDGLEDTVKWYQEHKEWWQKKKQG